MGIEGEGGMDPQTAPGEVTAGADVLVAGTAVFGAPGGAAEGMRRLQASIAGLGPCAG